MLAACALLMLTAAAPIKLASPGFHYAGLDAAVGDALLDRFVVELGKRGGVQITTKDDIAQVLGLERQRQLLGCSDTSTSCMVEMMNGLGVDAILTGSLAKVGSSYTIALRIIRANSGAEIATASGRLKSDDALQDWLDAQAAELAIAVARVLRPGQPETATVSSGSGRGVLPWVPGIAGLVIAGVGGVLFGVGKSDAAQLQARPAPPMDDVTRLSSQGRLFEPLGVAMLCAGGALMAASVVWLVLGDAGAPRVALAPLPGGSVLSLTGRF